MGTLKVILDYVWTYHSSASGLRLHPEHGFTHIVVHALVSLCSAFLLVYAPPLATLITFLVNTSWSTPTTDADGALDFVSGLRLHLRFGSAISGLRAVRSTLTGPQLCWLRCLGLHLAWVCTISFQGLHISWSTPVLVSPVLRFFWSTLSYAYYVSGQHFFVYAYH